MEGCVLDPRAKLVISVVMNVSSTAKRLRSIEICCLLELKKESEAAVITLNPEKWILAAPGCEVLVRVWSGTGNHSPWQEHGSHSRMQSGS